MFIAPANNKDIVICDLSDFLYICDPCRMKPYILQVREIGPGSLKQVREQVGF
jgi:hypothetical protein